MPKHSLLLDVFQGDHITIILKQLQMVETDHPDQFIQGNAMVQGFFVEMDDDFLYLAQELPRGISECIDRFSVFRIIKTDTMENTQPEPAPIPPSEMN